MTNVSGARWFFTPVGPLATRERGDFPRGLLGAPWCLSAALPARDDKDRNVSAPRLGQAAAAVAIARADFIQPACLAASERTRLAPLIPTTTQGSAGHLR